MGIIRAFLGEHWDIVRSPWDSDVRAASTEPWREKWVAGGLQRGARQAASPADCATLERLAAAPPGAATG